MVSSFFRQYRRIFLCTLLGVAALLLFIMASPAGAIYAHLVSPLGIAVMTALMLVFSGLMVALGVVVGARYLQLAETFMLSFLTLSLVTVLLPTLQMPHWVLGLALLLLPLAFDALLYGSQWKGTARDHGPTRLRFHTTASPDVVWRRLCPDPAHSADFYKGGATIGELPGGASGDLLVRYPFRAAKNGVIETIVRLDEKRENIGYRARFFTYYGPAGPWNNSPEMELVGTEEVTILPVDGGGALVTIDTTDHELPLPEHFKMWLTGWAADVAAGTKARIEGRADRSLVGRYAKPAAVLEPPHR